VKNRLQFILFLFPVLAWGTLSAQKQGQVTIDSALYAANKMPDDTDKVIFLYTLSYNYRDVDPTKGLLCGQQALSLAPKMNWKKGMGWANNNIGIDYRHKSDYPRAFEYLNKSRKIFEEMGDKPGLANVIRNMGEVYRNLGDFPKALEYDFNALKMEEEGGNKKGSAVVMQNIGNVYYALGTFPKALEYYLDALKIQEEDKDENSIARTSGKVGMVYRSEVNYPKALEYFNKAINIAESTGNKSYIAEYTGAIGEVYAKQKDYLLAIKYYERSMKINEEIGEKQGMAVNYEYMGRDFLLWSQDTVIPAGSIPVNKSVALRNAVDNLQRGLAISIEIRAPDIERRCYENLVTAYKLIGDYKRALESSDNARAIRDSLFSKENNDKVAALGMQRAFDKKSADVQKTAALKLQRVLGLTYMGFAGIVLLLVFSFFITKERRKSEKLLLNILPEEVADELKHKGFSVARYFNEVTVLFTDFVDFTEASMRLTPQELVNELDACFKAFDVIMDKNKIEKIKTVGDAYLAVCGLPQPTHEHAVNVVSAALEIRDFMAKRKEKMGEKTFAIRIGIHSGSVVAGIVGLKKFAYDIWGDTVNTAARMEQNSEPGKINISETTYDLVKDKFECECRGEIEAKNKGQLKMYFVS
jgi:adenylate cyclase